MELDTLTDLTQSRLKVKISRKDKSVESFADDVLKGLSTQPKYLPPKYFYDKIGSKIFEEICELKEYYPTRTESAILRKYAKEIASQFSTKTKLVELGSGNSVKTRLLIEAFLNRHRALHYLPIDISKTILVESSRLLLKEYAGLKVTSYVSDYFTALEAFRRNNIGPKMFVFLGSNIGNFEPTEAELFLLKIHLAMTSEDRLLIGMDLMKEKSVLESAYNDKPGVTAKFNLNLLHRINRDLEGEFDLAKFRHQAPLNEKLGRIEMHLESLHSQRIFIRKLDRHFEFEKGETIHTENSYKYTDEQIRRLANRNGFEIEHSWYDENKWFSLHLFKPEKVAQQV
ncbi:MAG: L-histidine N(alpha)-methyltransferase [bacterium]